MEQLNHILFIDIETAPCAAAYDDLSENLQQQWVRKTGFWKRNLDEESSPAQLFSERAGIFSEFARVVCIGIGCLVESGGSWKMVLKALADPDEKVLLNKFCSAIARFTEQFRDLQFCGHNIKEFDIPFLCRRMIIQGVKLPVCLQIHGKKPWEVTHLDTLELWRFGDYKHFTSLALLAEVLGIPSPKDDLDGSMVGDVFWKDGDLERISKYCLQDVYTTARVYLRLRGYHDIVPERQVVTD